MVEIGKINRLLVKEIRQDMLYLDGSTSGDILLREEVSLKKYKPGDEIEVFVYVDREQQLLATRQKPLAMVGDFALLKVVASKAAGAFMDWGLESDLLVPKSEQQEMMQEGESYLVYIFLSRKNNRITASLKLDKFLSRWPPKYQEGEKVDLLISAKTAQGYSAVINKAHAGMIYQNEIFQDLTIGQRLKGYIKKVRDDLKIDLSLQQAGYQRVDGVSQAILNAIQESGGKIALTDKSAPEEIYAMFGVSKKVFKKAVGALYKKKHILIVPDGIRLAE